jgi:beta-glucosidase
MTPLYPFGFGLSYTSFAVSDLKVNDSGFEADGDVTATVTVTNTGARAGSTVVQLYVSDAEASSPRPAKELKAFAKVALDAGESRQVTLTLDARSFAFFRAEAKHWLVESGDFTLHVGIRRDTILMLPV